MRLVPSLAALCAATSLTAVEVGIPIDPLDDADEVIVVTAQRLAETQDAALQPVDVIAENERRSAGYPIQPTDLVAELPGVWLQQTGAISGNRSLRLRGAPGYGTLVLIDGVPLHDPSGLQSESNLTVLNPAGIASTEVLRGPQSGLYGSRAIGGVVHFRPLVASAEHASFVRVQGGSFETVDALAQASGPISGSSGYAVGLSGTRSKGISALTSHDNGDPLDHEADGFSRAGVYGRLEHHVVEGLTVFVALDTMQAETEIDDFMQPDSEEPVTDYGISRLHSGLRLTDVEADRFSAGIDLAYTLIDREMPAAAFGSKEWNGREAFASIYGGWRPIPLLKLSAGADLRHESTENTAVDNSTSLDEDASHLGLWLRSEVSQQRWGISGTIRHDDHSEQGDATTWQVTAALEAIPQRMRLHALVGTSFRAPSLYESLSQDALWGGGGTVGNPELESETGFGFAIGHRSQLAEHVLLSNTIFSTRFDQRIDWDNGYVNTDQKERIDGVESELQIDPSAEMPLEIRITYTWQSFDHAKTLSRRLPENLLRSAFTWHAPHDLRLQIAVTAVDQRSDGAATLSPYTLVDAAASWRIDQRWEVFVRGENLTDADYELVDGYATTGIAAYIGGSGRF